MSGKIRTLCVTLFACLTTSCSTLSKTHQIQFDGLSIVLRENDPSDWALWDFTLYSSDTESPGNLKLQERSIQLSFGVYPRKHEKRQNFSLKNEESIPMVLAREDAMPICSLSPRMRPVVLSCPPLLLSNQ